MSRMFLIDGAPMKTWNVWVGCRFDCVYCSAKKLAKGRLKRFPQYAGGFEPKLVENLLRKTFPDGSWVFVGYMGDISFAPRDIIENILAIIQGQPQVKFLFCTKNPAVYSSWRFMYPSNLYLGATIETNYDYQVSKAPAPVRRYEAMVQLEWPKKFISIEPIMDFHLATMARWMAAIHPAIIEVGADNYGNKLVEPHGSVPEQKAPWKVKWLLDLLRKSCPTVVEKPGLERLKGIS